MRLWEPLPQSQSYGVGTSTDSCPQATVAVVGSLSPASGLSVASRMAAFCVGPQRLHEPSVCTRASRLVRVCDLRRSNRGSDWATARPYRTAGLDRCTRGTACLVLSRVVPAPPGRKVPSRPAVWSRGSHGSGPTVALTGLTAGWCVTVARPLAHLTSVPRVGVQPSLWHRAVMWSRPR